MASAIKTLDGYVQMVLIGETANIYLPITNAAELCNLPMLAKDI